MVQEYIYCLYEEGKSEIRYIGKASNIIKRLKEHIRESMRGKLSPKCNWIRKVIERGGKIKIRIIKKVEASNWKDYEKSFISACRERRFRLLNIADGGDGFGSGDRNPMFGVRLKGKLNGMYNKRHTVDARRRMSINRPDVSGEKNPMWGKSHNERTRRLCRLATRKQKMTPKIKRKIANAMMGAKNHFYGKRHTESTKKMFAEIRYKKVEKLAIGGKIVLETFPSLRSAQASIVRGNVGDCCRGLQKTAGGFVWRYKKITKKNKKYV